MELDGLCPLTTEAALRRAAAIAPDVEAIVGPDGRLTFAALAEEVARLRAALAAAGVGRGEHVGLCLGNGVRWLALFLAIGSLGAVAVPVNTRFKAEELAYALRQARMRTLLLGARVLTADLLGMLRAICPGIDTALPDPALPDLLRVVVLDGTAPPGCLGWDAFRAAAAAPVPARCTPDDTLLINGFVSGGRMGLRIADRFHSARPFFHVAGTTLSIIACLQHAATLVTMARFEPAEALRLLEEERCTHVSGNDTMALMLLNHPDLPRRRLVLRGAWAAASPAILRRIAEELGAREVVAGYGLSEASPNVAQSCWWEDEAVRLSGRMRPQPGIEIRLRDGEILVRGWSVMRGYFDKPAETAAAIDAEGWLATGDIGRLGADGRLEFLGRAKEIIRVGGENVAPSEVEDLLHRHPAIRQAVVVGVPDPRLMEVPCAVVVLNHGATATADELMAWARERIAVFKAPRHVLLVEGFEGFGMTASAKVQRRPLAEHAARLLGLAATPP